MLNFIPKRSVNLLFGKRPIQRIEVGSAKHFVELPMSVVEGVYKNLDTSTTYHNGDFHPMRWRDYLKLKLDVHFLTSAALAGDQASKTALAEMKWYGDICTLYSGQQRLVETHVAEESLKVPRKLTYPIQGVNV